jgi:hypothetical protein
MTAQMEDLNHHNASRVIGKTLGNTEKRGHITHTQYKLHSKLRVY